MYLSLAINARIRMQSANHPVPHWAQRLLKNAGRYWRCLVRDDLLVAMSDLYLALIVMQFSGGVIQTATGRAAVTVAFLAVWSFQLFAANTGEAPQREADQYDTGGKAYHRHLP